MSKTFQVSMPEEIANALIEEAKNEQLTVSSYLTMITKEQLKDVIKENNKDDETNDSQDGGRLCIEFYGKDSALVKRKAADLGLTPTSYLRRLAYTKDFKIIDFTTDDLEGFLADIGRLINAITSCINMAKRYSGKIFPQDIELIKNNLDKIIKLSQEQIVISLNDRKRVYNKMMKKIMEE